jgi:ATP-dependent Clp protease ATP-binding subunit ClpB
MLRQKLPPEFLNRIDDIIVFKPLSEEEIRQIVALQAERVGRMLRANNIGFEIDSEALDWLAQLGYDITYGARPLRRVIQRHLINPLSTMLLEGEFSAGDVVRVTVSETGQFEFHNAAPE